MGLNAFELVHDSFSLLVSYNWVRDSAEASGLQFDEVCLASNDRLVLQPDELLGPDLKSENERKDLT